MFFAEERLEAVRCMILAPDDATRQQWLTRIEPMQRDDFVEILRSMDGCPVTVRLLDWPLHEFLPKNDEELGPVAAALGEPLAQVRERARALAEVNPMLGYRAVRAGLTIPAIVRTQIRALMAAVAHLRAEGCDPRPEVMVPVVCLVGELAAVRRIIEDEMARAVADFGEVGEVPIGTMIELPRACLVADQLAACADFFSFGTNDLTQTTLGISRDDAGRFLPAYIEELGILDADPFAHLDEDGVGALVAMACERGRGARSQLKLGICGEHGGDPRSIAFVARLGLDYVSCSPPRLPIARLAAAQVALRGEG